MGESHSKQPNQQQKKIEGPILQHTKQIKTKIEGPILQHTTQIKTNLSVDRVKKIHPAMAGSFVVQFYESEFNNIGIAHYSSSGSKLQQLSMASNSGVSLEMASENLAIIINSLYQSLELAILLWDLRTYQIVKVNHLRKTSLHQLHIFPQSNLLCIQETLFYQSDLHLMDIVSSYYEPRPIKFYFTYYKFPTLDSENKPICITSYQIPKQKVSFGFKAIRVNEISMLALITDGLTPEQPLNVPMHKIMQNGDSAWKSYKFHTDFNKNKEVCSVKILDLWQIGPRVMYINVCTEADVHFKRHFNQANYSVEQLRSMQKNFSSIWQLEKGFCRPTKYTISDDHQLQLLGVYRNDRRIVEVKPDFQTRILIRYPQYGYHPKYKPISIYYIDIKAEKIIATEKINEPNTGLAFESRNINSSCRPVYDLSRQVDYKLERNGYLQICERKIRTLQYSGPEIAAFFLINFMENCDDDLIFFVTGLLKDDEHAEE